MATKSSPRCTRSPPPRFRDEAPPLPPRSIATTTLRRFPYAWPFVPGWPDVRRYVLSRFPYSILYRASATQLEIIAVSHQRRSPDYWAERAK